MEGIGGETTNNDVESAGQGAQQLELEGGAAAEAGISSGLDSENSTTSKLEADQTAVENETVAETLKRVLAKSKKSNDSSDEESDASEQDAEETTGDASEDDEVPLLAPSGWTKAEKEAFYNAPKQAQEAFNRREKELQQVASRANTELHRLKTEYEQKVSQGDSEYGEIYETVEQLYPGSDRKEMIGNLLKFDILARKSPFKAVDILARTHGMNAVQFVDEFDKYQDRGGAFEHADYSLPELDPTAKELKTLRAELADMKQQQQGNERTKIESLIEQVGSEKNESGQLKRPYFMDIQGEIAAVMPLIDAKYANASLHERLQRAYDFAVNGNEETRSRLQAIKQQKQIAAKHEVARKVMPLNRASTSSIGQVASEVVPYDESPGETMRRILNRQNKRQ